MQHQPQSPAPDSATALLSHHAETSRFKPWMIELVARVQRGVPLDEARTQVGAGLSVWTVERFRKDIPLFDQAIREAQESVATLGVDDARAIAQARAAGLVSHFASQALNQDPETGKPQRDPVLNYAGEVVGYRDAVRPRDQQGAGRLVLEAAGVVGRPPPDQSAKETAKAFLAELIEYKRQARERDAEHKRLSPPYPPSTVTESQKVGTSETVVTDADVARFRAHVAGRDAPDP